MFAWIQVQSYLCHDIERQWTSNRSNNLTNHHDSVRGRVDLDSYPSDPAAGRSQYTSDDDLYRLTQGIQFLIVNIPRWQLFFLVTENLQTF